MAAYSAGELASLRVAQWVAEERKRLEFDVPTQSTGVPPEWRTITISRQYGAGGHTIAGLVAKRLGPAWEIWDKEIVEEVAKKAHVRPSLISALDEHSFSPEEELLRYITNSWGIKPEVYYRSLVDVLLGISRCGNKIIVGRGSSFILKNALHVRLCASEPYRVQMIVAKEHVDEAAARVRMAHVEEERTRFIKSFYHRNVGNPIEYDLLIQVDRVGPESAAAAIAAVMESRIRTATMTKVEDHDES